MIPCLLCWRGKPLQKGSALEGKYLLLEEIIVSFKSLPPFRRGGGEYKNGRVASSGKDPIHFKNLLYV